MLVPVPLLELALKLATAAARWSQEALARRGRLDAPEMADGFERELFESTPEELVVRLRGVEPGSVRGEQIRALLAVHEVRQASRSARWATCFAGVAVVAAIAQAVIMALT